MGDVRRWLHHRRFAYIAAALAGLIIAGSVSMAWQRSFNEPAVTLLGSGHGLSALISTGSARVLVVGGDDPIAFANALADARPPTMRRIDIVVLTPGASPSMAERAVELANPARIMAIDARDPGEHEDGPAISNPVRRISAPRTIDLGGDLLLDIDPGLIAGQPSIGWTVRLHTGSITVLLAETVPFRPEPGIRLVAIMGNIVPVTIRNLSIPVLMSADAEIASFNDYGTIEPGEAQRLPITPEGLVVPAGWVRPDDE